MPRQPSLLCLDLQTDIGHVAPDARTVFGAHQLLALARRCGWTVVHARRRAEGTVRLATPTRRADSLRPLISERVFLRSRRAVSDCSALLEQMERWSDNTVYVASFDILALASVLIEHIDRGPHFVLVEDAIATDLLRVGSPCALREATFSLAPSIAIPDLVAGLGHGLAKVGAPGSWPTHA